jgi:hypothetical protein
MTVDETDYSVVVKNRAPPPKSWRWEIYRAGRTSPIEHSSVYFQTMKSLFGERAIPARRATIISNSHPHCPYRVRSPARPDRPWVNSRSDQHGTISGALVPFRPTDAVVRPHAALRRRKKLPGPAIFEKYVAGGLRRCGWRLFRISALAGTSVQAHQRHLPGTYQASGGACAGAVQHIYQQGVLLSPASFFPFTHRRTVSAICIGLSRHVGRTPAGCGQKVMFN